MGRKKELVSPLRCAPVGMTISFETRWLGAKNNKVKTSQDDDSVGGFTERKTFVREPGRTADPSAALGMTKGEDEDFY
jgi:hypothetical protein